MFALVDNFGIIVVVSFNCPTIERSDSIESFRLTRVIVQESSSWEEVKFMEVNMMQRLVIRVRGCRGKQLLCYAQLPTMLQQSISHHHPQDPKDLPKDKDRFNMQKVVIVAFVKMLLVLPFPCCSPVKLC